MRIPLNPTQVSKLQKPGRYFDAGSGLHLWINNSLKRYWIFRYCVRGKRQDMSLGSFPSVSLSEARKRAFEAKVQLSNGMNPLSLRKRLKNDLIERAKSRITFREFAKQCIEAKSHEWRNSKHENQWRQTIAQFANPIIGDKGIDEISTEDILKVLSPIWANKTETASRLRGRIEWILASATARKMRSGVNPAQWRGHLDTILPKPNRINKTQHHKALNLNEIPSFMERLRSKEGVSALALEFTILTCARTGEVIGAKRSEISNNLWVVPPERMKAGKEHRVPLSPRAVELLGVARLLDPDSPYLFSSKSKPLSNMAMYSMLKRMGFNVTVHGFRSCFRDWVSERTNHSPELAEKALAHQITNRVEAAYRRGDLVEKRAQLMIDWEAFCYQEVSANIVQFKSA